MKFRIITNKYKFVVQEFRRGLLDWRLNWKDSDIMRYAGDVTIAEFDDLEAAKKYKLELEEWELQKAATDWQVVE